ncbi:hypothetical protein ACWCQ1_49415 [Streptomyces sp. NPDC002144]
MSKTTASDNTRSGGLPEDDGSLDGFALPQAAAAAFAPTARRPAPPAHPASPIDAAAAGHRPTAAALPDMAPPQQPPRPAAPHNPTPAAHSRADSQDPFPCLIMVDTEVRRRFEQYQTTQKLATGHEPTNAVVVRRAFLHAKRNDLFQQLREDVRHQQQPLAEEDLDEDGLFGDVPNRRVERGRTKSRTQQSFRPSGRELAVYDAFCDSYLFPNRSDFLNAILDAFLPPLPSAPKRSAR